MNVKGTVCSNSFSYSTSVKITGLDLSHAGSLQGTVALGGVVEHNAQNNGICNYSVQPSNEIMAYNATWDGTNGSMVVHALDGHDLPRDVFGTFKSSVSVTPVFPMTVTGTVTLDLKVPNTSRGRSCPSRAWTTIEPLVPSQVAL